MRKVKDMIQPKRLAFKQNQIPYQSNILFAIDDSEDGELNSRSSEGENGGSNMNERDPMEEEKIPNGAGTSSYSQNDN